MRPTQTPFLILLFLSLVATNDVKSFDASKTHPQENLLQEPASKGVANGLGKGFVLQASTPTAVLAVGPGGQKIEVSPTELELNTEGKCLPPLKLLGDSVNELALLDPVAPPKLGGQPPVSAPISAPPPSSASLAPPVNIGQSFSGATPAKPSTIALPTSAARPLSTSYSVAQSAASNERAVELVDATLKQKRAIEEAARRDTQQIVNAVADIPVSRLGEAFLRARDKAQGTSEALLQAKTGIDAGEAKRFGNYFLNARDKADAAIDAVATAQAKDQIDSQSPFRTFLTRGPAGGSELKQALSEIFAGMRDTLSPTSQETLTDRIVLYNSLDPTVQERIKGDVALLEPVEVTGPNGEKQKIDLLHNGYLLFAGKSGVSCSTLASAVLGPRVRQGGLTTLDFRTIWEFQQTGVFPGKPTYKDANREKLVRKVSQAFSSHNLYQGERPRPGDFLVYSVPWKTSGHVFIVRNYNAQTMKAQVLEAAQSAGGIRDREFSLTLYPSDAPVRHVRAGLMILRLQQSDPQNSCKKDVEVASR